MLFFALEIPLLMFCHVRKVFWRPLLLTLRKRDTHSMYIMSFSPPLIRYHRLHIYFPPLKKILTQNQLSTGGQYLLIPLIPQRVVTTIYYTWSLQGLMSCGSSIGSRLPSPAMNFPSQFLSSAAHSSVPPAHACCTYIAPYITPGLRYKHKVFLAPGHEDTPVQAPYDSTPYPSVGKEGPTSYLRVLYLAS